MSTGIKAIDAVVNIGTKEALAGRPDRRPFFVGKMNVGEETFSGISLEETLRLIGAHTDPHWFELPPDHAKYYPFYAKCCELDVPIQMQVGQSLVHDRGYPRRSTGRSIAFDAVACDLPKLKVVGIHAGIPWTDEMIAMAWKHRDAYIGSDAHGAKYWPPSFVDYINTYGQDKVLFGTDFPVPGFERVRADIESLNLRPEAKCRFLRDSPLNLYEPAP